ncbi:MotE family protein [Tianweitania sediminis]|jgi:flagellar motility protein MotE (MotC chaperone)|uniref:MotE family protein n=1 Tax=Tianweitania sediminis TaxID=1502156 RepID=UPI001FD802B8|nr:MotE family protein [Tianweitania sediminis]HEV7417883.1 MotE family protein [Tianweitania sediminis]
MIRLGLSMMVVAAGFASSTFASSATEQLDLATPPAKATGTESEIQRFCSNIADAARDRRYQIQAQELATLQADIDKRLEALEAKRREYEEWLKRRDDFLNKAEDGVVEIYSKMRPDAAAERMAELSPELAAGILMKLEARKASVILNEMERKTAAALTAVMASAARKEDPT